MTTLKKKLLTLLTIPALLVTAACSSSTSNTAGVNGGKTKIVVTFHEDEIGEGDTVETIFGEFLKENPDIEIEIMPIDSDDPNLLARIASGNAPDVLRISAPSDIPTFVTRDLLMPLDDYIESSDLLNMDDMYDTVNLFRFDGSEIGKGPIYGLPKDWSIESQMWINTELFEEAGVRIPTSEDPMTFEEYAEACRKITKRSADGSLEVIGGVPFTNEIETYLEYMLCQKGKSFWSDDYKSTTSLTDPDTREAIEYIYNLQKDGVIHSKLNEVDAYTWFGEGRVGMWTTGYWAVQYLNNSYDGAIKIKPESIKLVPGPVYDKDKRISAVTKTTGGGIYKGTKNPDAAFRVLEYILGGAPATVRAEKGFGYPINKNLTDKLPVTTDIEKMALESVNHDITYLYNNPRVNPYISAASLRASFNKFYVPALYDQCTLDEALESMEKDIKILVQEGEEIMNEN